MGNVGTVYVLLGGWALLERNRGPNFHGTLPLVLGCALAAFQCAIFLLDNATAITNLLSVCIGVAIALWICKEIVEEKRPSHTPQTAGGGFFAPPTPTVDINRLQYLKRQAEEAKEVERRRNELYWAARIQREREQSDRQAREEAERKEQQRQAHLRREREEEAERRRRQEEAAFERRQQAEAFQRRQREEEDESAFQRRQGAERG